MAPFRASVLLAGSAVWMLGACSLLVNTGDLSGGAVPEIEAGDARLDAGTAGDTPNELDDAQTSGSDATNERDAGMFSADSSAPMDGPPRDGTASDSAEREAQASESGGQDAPAEAPQDAPVEAPQDSPADAPACLGNLSNTGTADFHISLSVSTAQTGQTALVNQRNRCGHGMFWDIRLASGAVHVETDDGVTQYVLLVSTGALVNDGKFHDLEVARVAGALTISIDGTGSGSASSPTSFGVLPPIAIGTDPCDTDAGQTVPFVGTVRSLCVTSP